MNERFNQLRDEVSEAIDTVTHALDAGEDQIQLAAGRRVEEVSRHYSEFLDELEDGPDRERVDRMLGRRVTDLRRLAQSLTRRSSGSAVPLANDAGSIPFLERRAPPKSIVPGRAFPTRNSPKFAVGGETEAWCGKCNEFRDHNIVAMVGDMPKQVICKSCRSRHGYRTEPSARGAAARAPVPVPTASRVSSTNESREAARKKDAKEALLQELNAAPEPRTFNPKERYKAGEIIAHPEHGRGKIENVLKGSLLVRFREGLRPLDLA